MAASKLLLLGLASFLVVSASATGDGSGDGENDDILVAIGRTTRAPDPADNEADDYAYDDHNDDDSQGEWADQDMRDQEEAQIRADQAARAAASANGNVNTEDVGLSSSEIAAIVILSLLIVVALGVAAFYLKKTRDLQADHLVGLVNERNMYDDHEDRASVYGSAAATDTLPRSSSVGGWNVEVNRQSKSAAQSQAYGAPTDIMAEMHGNGGHEEATMPGLIGSTSV